MKSLTVSSAPGPGLGALVSEVNDRVRPLLSDNLFPIVGHVLSRHAYCECPQHAHVTQSIRSRTWVSYSEVDG